MHPVIRRLLALAALALIASAPALAKEFPAAGSTGSALFDDRCPEGQYLVGLKVRAGLWLDQITVACAPMKADGTLGERNYPKPPHGGQGGGPQEERCDPPEVVTSVAMTFTKNGEVRDLYFRCNRKNAARHNPTDQHDGFIVGGSGNWQSQVEQVCPLDELATGLRGRYGQYVNALGLICGPKPKPILVVLPKVPKPAPTPAPAPAPAPVDLSSFTGVWDTTTSGGGAFTVILDVKGNAVTGVIGHAEAKYSGTLQGDMDVGGRKFGYSYVQPQIGGSGKGIFTLSDDGKSMSGDFVTDQDTTQRYRWTGKRRD